MAEPQSKPVVIHYHRPGKDTHRYVEQRIDANATRLKTISRLAPEFSRRWCEENWWKNGFIPPGTLVGAVVKYLFYRQWFAVMQLLGEDDQHLGYYVDIIAPLQRDGDEYTVVDLFLDLWVTPDGEAIELDRDEFEQAYRARLITPQQYAKAGEAIEQLKQDITGGKFFLLVR